MDPNDRYETRAVPKLRRLVVDAGKLARHRHPIHGLVEFDVTDSRARVRGLRQAGQDVSFTGFVIHCLSLAIAADRLLNAYLDWRGRLVVFDDVDVLTLIESRRDQVAVSHVIRAANRRSLDEICSEIRQVQEAPASSPSTGWMAIGASLPRFLRAPFWWYLRCRPVAWKRMGGTVAVTAVGMFGSGAGWGIPFGNHTLVVTLGGTTERPGFVDGRLEPRQILCVTVTVDHDIVDGAPVARFVERFKKLVEAAHGLPEPGRAAE